MLRTLAAENMEHDSTKERFQDLLIVLMKLQLPAGPDQSDWWSVESLSRSLFWKKQN